MATSTLNRTAVIYARISLDRTGEGAGVDRQESECHQLAARLGLDVSRVYVDNDISATSGAERPQFKRMLADRPAAIITWAQDRLLRLSADLEKVITLNIPVHMVTQGTLDLATPAGRAVARTVAAWSTFETEQKGLRQLAANDQRAAKGQPTVRPGYGYRRVDGRDVVEANEAAIIQEVASRILAGEPLRAVARDLNSRQVPSPGGAPWQGVTLRQLVTRPSLAGLRTHRGRVVSAFDAELHPAILERDTHDRLIALVRDPARTVSGVGRPPQHLLSGIAICGKCGAKMRRMPGRMTTTKRGGAKRQPPAYGCPVCYGVRRKQSDVEAFVVAVLLRRLESPDALDLVGTTDPAGAAAARDAVAAIDARLSSAADAYAAGAIELSQLTRITTQLRADRDAHAAALTAALPSSLPADLAGPRVKERWATLGIEARRAVLSALLRITVQPSGPGRDFNPELIRIDWLTDTASAEV
ncbi:recombinase family protein [Microbacterium sp. EYE_384]|uniref:recombinase family protein n=1 Tax=unclassified Microbacterium TaxID=2609290 RepID=UPI00200576B4|nr:MULTISPECIES: recombinase family protein [unclassified Microbacterium]MCK6086239.1 recombinase family protein [Microbacterium sp. EYE_384]MCK6127172.1 recombinase family protein [Microbacterium sp. EYE_79]MCK6247678.1 recombinase family protein [Microbacterium sp. EYE_78]